MQPEVSVPLRGLDIRKQNAGISGDLAAFVSVPLRGLDIRKHKSGKSQRQIAEVSVPLRGLDIRKQIAPSIFWMIFKEFQSPCGD